MFDPDKLRVLDCNLDLGHGLEWTQEHVDLDDRIDLDRVIDLGKVDEETHNKKVELLPEPVFLEVPQVEPCCLAM